jgi:hypothetical protein
MKGGDSTTGLTQKEGITHCTVNIRRGKINTIMVYEIFCIISIKRT